MREGSTALGGCAGGGDADEQLAFGSTATLRPLYDNAQRPVTVAVNAYLGGTFILSCEAMSDSGRSENVLTCYRRNRFQVGGEVSLSGWPASFSPSSVDNTSINQLLVRLTAVESRDWTQVMILAAASRDQAASADGPVDIGLPIEKSSGIGGQDQPLRVPFLWGRLQFRSATANNGRKRREIRQQFRLDVSLLASQPDGSLVCVALASSPFLAVRGRSPKSFRSRNDHPLCGQLLYSAGSEPQLLGYEDVRRDQPGCLLLPDDLSFSHPAVSYSEADAPKNSDTDQAVYSPNMWDWIDLNGTDTESFPQIVPDPNNESCAALQPAEEGDIHQTELENAEATPRYDRTATWPPVSISTGLSFEAGTVFDDARTQPSAVALVTQRDASLPVQASSAIDQDDALIQVPMASTNPMASRQPSNAPDVSLGVETDVESSQSSPKARGRYKYIPVGVGGWQPPVEPVYWPHPWSHVHKPLPWTYSKQPQGARQPKRLWSALGVQDDYT